MRSSSVPSMGNRSVSSFHLISPTVRAHLRLLSRLSFALQDPRFKAVIQRQGARDEIFAEAHRVEAGLKHALRHQPSGESRCGWCLLPC